MTTLIDLDDLKSQAEISRFLGVNISTFTHWRERFDDFPSPVKEVGRFKLYSQAEVARWYATLEERKRAKRAAAQARRDEAKRRRAITTVVCSSETGRTARSPEWVDEADRPGADFTDEEIFESLRRHADYDNKLAKTDYDKRKFADEISSVRIFQRFGSWNAAIEAAGLTPFPSTKHHYNPVTDEEIKEALMKAIIMVEWSGKQRLTYEKYGKLAKQEGWPSNQTVRNRFGTWRKVRVMMGLTP